MAKTPNTESIEFLAAEIGDNVYIDIAKWHLYLKDAHLHIAIAEKIYPLLADKSCSEKQIQEIMSNIPVKVGGGKREIPLLDLLPMQCQVKLMDILEEFQRQM